MKVFGLLQLLYLIPYSFSQYVINNGKQPTSSCDGPGKNALVEQFFNVIFSEFHNTPPHCVCVQMCADQSTYCYPNGCLKRDEAGKAKKVDYTPQTVTNIQNENSKPFMMIVNDKNDFMSDLLEKKYVDDSIMVLPEKPVMPKMRPDPFKDKYKTLYKYKKMPKVELRYNLREQVKHMKSDLIKLETIDVSKTRWPLKKPNTYIPKTYNKVKKQKAPINSNFFLPPLSEIEPNYSSKYFKRDVKKTLASNGVNLKATYLQENTDANLENASFSLEALIDNLIESSIETNNAELDVKIVSNNTKGNEIIKTKAPIGNVLNENTTSLANEATKVISMNSTDENLDKNKYKDDSNVDNYTDAFNEMKTLSKRIEVQNNTSLEIIKRVADNIDIIYDIESTTKALNDIKMAESDLTPLPITKETNHENIITTTEAQTGLPTTTNLNYKITTKTNRQRISRKLQNGKTN